MASVSEKSNAVGLGVFVYFQPMLRLKIAPADSKTGFSKWPIWGGFLPRRPPWGLARREPGLGGPGKAHIRVVNEGQGQKKIMKGF